MVVSVYREWVNLVVVSGGERGGGAVGPLLPAVLGLHSGPIRALVGPSSCRYVTAATTAASGYSYWHYGRKTVRVLNTKSP